uniref:Uncharacterized protein n=1 Tax=Anguilla anguilla TaxID=7936 RepID=A0A0E9UQI6_ANGAN
MSVLLKPRPSKSCWCVSLWPPRTERPGPRTRSVGRRRRSWTENRAGRRCACTDGKQSQGSPGIPSDFQQQNRCGPHGYCAEGDGHTGQWTTAPPVQHTDSGSPAS